MSLTDALVDIERCSSSQLEPAIRNRIPEQPAELVAAVRADSGPLPHFSGGRC